MLEMFETIHCIASIMTFSQFSPLAIAIAMGPVQTYALNCIDF